MMTMIVKLIYIVKLVRMGAKNSETYLYSKSMDTIIIVREKITKLFCMNKEPTSPSPQTPAIKVPGPNINV